MAVRCETKGMRAWAHGVEILVPGRVGALRLWPRVCCSRFAAHAQAAPVSPWRTVPSPNQGAKANALYGVSAIGPSHAWAIGEGSGAALIERWNGTTWSIVDPRR